MLDHLSGKRLYAALFVLGSPAIVFMVMLILTAQWALLGASVAFLIVFYASAIFIHSDRRKAARDQRKADRILAESRARQK